jgi:hypothetical protein
VIKPTVDLSNEPNTDLLLSHYQGASYKICGLNINFPKRDVEAWFLTYLRGYKITEWREAKHIRRWNRHHSQGTHLAELHRIL